MEPTLTDIPWRITVATALLGFLGGAAATLVPGVSPIGPIFIGALAGLVVGIVWHILHKVG